MQDLRHGTCVELSVVWHQLEPLGHGGSTVAVVKPHGNTKVVSVNEKRVVAVRTASSVHETTQHVIFEAAIAFGSHESRLKDTHGELCHRQVKKAGVSAAKHEVNARVEGQIR